MACVLCATALEQWSSGLGRMFRVADVTPVMMGWWSALGRHDAPGMSRDTPISSPGRVTADCRCSRPNGHVAGWLKRWTKSAGASQRVTRSSA